jgi:hypothetical protein
LQLPSHYEDMTSDDWATIHIDMPARVLTERARTRKRLLLIKGSKCYVCDAKFNTFKDFLEHIITNAHQRQTKALPSGSGPTHTTSQGTPMVISKCKCFTLMTMRENEACYFTFKFKTKKSTMN